MVVVVLVCGLCLLSLLLLVAPLQCCYYCSQAAAAAAAAGTGLPGAGLFATSPGSLTSRLSRKTVTTKRETDSYKEVEIDRERVWPGERERVCCFCSLHCRAGLAS